VMRRMGRGIRGPAVPGVPVPTEATGVIPLSQQRPLFWGRYVVEEMGRTCRYADGSV